MKKNILLPAFAFLQIAFCLLPISFATAQTNVSGFISANTTWNLAGSPYVVVGNTILSAGYTLTIDPGVVVKFDPAKAIQIDGELHAVGTAANRITFTSNQIVPASGDWGQIQFSDTCSDALFDASGNYLSGCVMKYCDVNYAGGVGSAAIDIDYSSVYMSNCRVTFSASNGINCYHGLIKIDSSAIRYSAYSGLILSVMTIPYCPYVIEYDTLEYNAVAGITGSAIYSNCASQVFIVRNNYFNFNTGPCLFISGAIKFLVSENEFLNNADSGSSGVMSFYNSSATIECNRFINNEAWLSSAIEIVNSPNDTIRNNFFYNNRCTFNSPETSLITIENPPDVPAVIKNNYFNGSVSPGGATLRLVGQSMTNLTTRYFITGNEFINSQGVSEISFEDPFLNTSSAPLAQISGNNFLQGSTQYAIDNRLPFSGADIDATGNYWNSTSTQHVDSVIYDFFDNANYSNVFYNPILNAPAVIDTTCPVIVDGINDLLNENSFNSTLFPNPFTTTATIKFSLPLHSATFRLYNLYGQKIMETSGINGETFRINAETLGSGVYVYEVMEKDKKICGGKAVVY